MKKAALMARVSSDEQAKGYSLDVQEDALKRYCERNNITIVKIFREDHSAKSFERPEFQAFLNYLKSNTGKIDLLLFTSWDRFSRNTGESYEMITRLKKLGVQPQAIEQPIDFSIPENKAMLAFYLALPEIENDRRSIKITGGIRGAWKAGRWTHPAPIGYKNSRDEQNKPLLIASDKAKHIRYIFQQIAQNRPQVEVRLAVKEKGVALNKSSFSALLRNPLYMGKIRVPAENGQAEYLAKAVHEPIVSEELFYQVQDVLSGNKKDRNRPSYTTLRKELPGRGIFLCSKCGSHLTGSPSRSHTGTRYFYYHCNHCKKERYKAEDINTVIENMLGDFKFKSDVNVLYKRILSDALNGGNKDKAIKIKSLQEQIDQQEERLNNLEDMLADKSIAAADYMKMKGKYETNRSNLLSELNVLKGADKELNQLLATGLKQIQNVSGLYNSFDPHRKLRLLGSIFPEKLVFDGEKCRTREINESLRLCLLFDKGLEKKKTGQLSKYLVLSGVVETMGVEPTTSCMPCKRSSQLSYVPFYPQIYELP